ncbi:hypothetical protein MKX01_003049, partial [Papaver californicum]
ALLLIMYNCSDQVLAIRERRNATSREAAAQSVQRTAQARERWKVARDIAKKHALGLQKSFSRTFSHQKTARQPEEMIILGNDSSTKSAPKGKDMHTDSQSFRYAYGKIEKEKALQQENKSLTFCKIVNMAAETEITSRPMIEVAFKDLTLTLKGKNKHLMRCVTGKIMPGHVSAVMGPSGAGKTTFLNALAGKKIIVFVPQDDIVHVNLTVEENLQFSAKCRYATCYRLTCMPKAESVLVIERVIDSLGLQQVRDSLVGTVEKRGISGGQRKRVNVGMEMVMEPSLLILDEPTSGLDSSSSQLLLRALRREALEGVNICTVVFFLTGNDDFINRKEDYKGLHLIGYSLFKMFDDLILLAKGGLIVYHGPVKKVKEYFAGLGIIVPDRVNPPDHFIDILEGIVPCTNTDMKQLPVRWMLHRGYRIPLDMQLEAANVASSSRAPDTSNDPECDSVVAGREDKSFAEDLWEDVWSSVELRRDHIYLNFLKSKDLSKRQTPGLPKQDKYYHGSILTHLFEKLDCWLAALLCKIAALRSFSVDKLIYWRESNIVDHFNTLVKPVLYLSMFYFFNNPGSSFMDYWSVLLPVVLTLVSTRKTTGLMTVIANLCYPKWTLQAFVISNAERYSGVWLITRCGSLMQTGYVLNWNFSLGILILYGACNRILAYFLMVTFQKK